MTTHFKNWAETFQLEDLRRLTLDRVELMREIEAGHYEYLSEEVVMFREAYEALAPWEKCCAHAMAHGLSADRAVVSGKAAARIWGMEVLGVDRRTELTYVLPTRPTRRRNWPEGVIFRSAHLHSHEFVELHGIRVTKVSRTLKDITRYYGLEDGVVAIDSARKMWPELTRELLENTLCGVARYHGKGLVRKAIGMSVGNAGSPLESRARVQILESGLAGPSEIVTQLPIRLPGRRETVYADIGVGAMVVVEADGRVKYDGVTYGKQADEVIRAEREREKAINNSGRIVVRVSHDDLRPGKGGESQFIRDLRGALRRAGQLSA